MTLQEYKNLNMVCLYIFSHNKTGLRYFGKTTLHFTIESLLKYGGSGKYWNEHLKVHGKDLSVEIYGIYKISEVKEIALKFSEDNNIVKSLNESGDRKGKKIWANLKPENGLDGGNNGGLFGEKNGFYGKKHSKEALDKMSNAKKGKQLTKEHKQKISDSGKGRIVSDETIKKQVKSRKGYTHSEETKRKLSKAHKGKIISEEEKIRLRTMNVGRKQSQETINKMKKAKQNMSDETKRKMSESRTGIKHPLITCPYCKKEGGNSGMKRYHFENCRLFTGEVIAK